MDWTYLTLAGVVIWFGILLLPWRPWANREVLDGDNAPADNDLAEITALIPARNEAKFLPGLVTGLKSQGKGLSAVLVNDQSTDGTAEMACRLGEGFLRVVEGRRLPAGWSGKLWALEQGYPHIHTRLTLLIDADIELTPGIVAALRNKMTDEGISFISLMAALRMVSPWERLFMPAFVYFFKLLYPFHLSNSGYSGVTAAAGGCILLETRLLRDLGGFNAIRGELIDDCALAKRVKSQGHKTWIGLTHSVLSHRPYDHVSEVWNMVARNAFAQLRCSAALLSGCTAIMIAAFWVPVAGLFFPTAAAKIFAASSLAAMMASYLPTLRFYGMSGMYAPALPLVGTLYLAMTWTSAVRYWTKRGAEWKGRRYLQSPRGARARGRKG